MTPSPDLAATVLRLEQEHRNLVTRLEKLEKRQGSSLSALAANVILLVAAGLLADYLGFFPAAVDRLPLAARTVEAEEFILRSKGGPVRARVIVDEQVGLRVLNGQGKTVFSEHERRDTSSKP